VPYSRTQPIYGSCTQVFPLIQLLVDGLVAIAPTVSEFFDGPTSVLVMADDDAVRQNRLIYWDCCATTLVSWQTLGQL